MSKAVSPPSVIAIIPARYASTRFPGKPLLRETGKYLIEHVYDRVGASTRIQSCVVATDDERIASAVRLFGGAVAMTRSDHPTGTDRIAEAIAGIPGSPDDLVINVQGDEPEIDPEYLDRLVGRMQQRPEVPVGTLACPFPAEVDATNPNCVKVVRNLHGNALYFSRSLIPYERDAGAARRGSGVHLHLGVYAYRRRFLLEFTRCSPTPLEQLEKLEQLRVLENGHALLVEIVEHAAVGIDTPLDYAAFVARWNARGQSR